MRRIRNTLPSKISEELTAVLPVLGLNVMSVEDKVEQPGSVLLNGIDRLQLIVASAATEEAINMIKQWVAILDSVDASTQEQLYVYKVAHGKASELAEALSVVFQTQGTSYSIDTSTGNSRTDSVNAVVSRNSSSSFSNRSDSIFLLLFSRPALKANPTASNPMTPITIVSIAFLFFELLHFP